MVIILCVLLVLAILSIKPILSNLGETGTFDGSPSCGLHLSEAQQRKSGLLTPAMSQRLD